MRAAAGQVQQQTKPSDREKLLRTQRQEDSTNRRLYREFRRKLKRDGRSVAADLQLRHHTRAEPPPPNEKIKLNLGGHNFVITVKTIQQRPGNTLLHQFVNGTDATRRGIADTYMQDNNEYFFERTFGSFLCVYNYYVTGQLHKPTHMCPYDFLYELEYWQMDVGTVAPCCQAWVQWNDESTASIKEGDGDGATLPPYEEDEFDGIYCGSVRRLVWNLVEVPESSLVAKVFSLVSMCFVILSNGGLIVGSLESMQDEDKSFQVLETICVSYFAMEYALKLVAAADRKATFLLVLFLLNGFTYTRVPMNIIDLLAILPFFFEVTLSILGYDVARLERFKTALLVIRILRILRVMRIFKMGKYSTQMQLVARTIIVSAPKLAICVVIAACTIMFFSSTMYFVEKDEPGSPFQSIPAGFWWGLVTVSGVGYGDMVPVTDLGKMISVCCVLCGLLVLAVPVTIIVENYSSQMQSKD